MRHRFEENIGQLVLRMPAELDHHSAEIMRRETDILMTRYPVRNIVFDFQDTVFMDSSGIGAILGRCRNLKFARGKAAAIHLSPQIQRIFRVSGLHKVIECSDLEEVREGFPLTMNGYIKE